MNIKIKYPVGYRFFVPRVYETSEKEIIKVPDTNGVLQEYARDIITLNAVAREKIVDHIEVTIADCVKIHYWCLNFGIDSMATIVPECDMSITDHDTALYLARRWRDEQCATYHGSTEY
jgi:hypothetical protein